MTLGRTPSQTVGPFFTLGLGRQAQHEIVQGGSVRIVGRVLDGRGEPVPDALVELWQSDDGETRWGRCATDGDGAFSFVTEATDDGFANVMVFARGLLKHLVTRCYFAAADDPVLDALEPDERATLIARPEGDALRFDIHLQGERQTVFFDV
jgi:protocatechuate 3,4-dioxygenase alpha subunit